MNADVKVSRNGIVTPHGQRTKRLGYVQRWFPAGCSQHWVYILEGGARSPKVYHSRSAAVDALVASPDCPAWRHIS